MAQLLVRDLKDETVAELKRRAKEHGRSAEAEHRALLEETYKRPSQDFWEDARKFREELRARGLHFNSAELIRKDRDSR